MGRGLTPFERAMSEGKIKDYGNNSSSNAKVNSTANSQLSDIDTMGENDLNKHIKDTAQKGINAAITAYQIYPNLMKIDRSIKESIFKSSNKEIAQSSMHINVAVNDLETLKEYASKYLQWLITRVENFEKTLLPARAVLVGLAPNAEMKDVYKRLIEYYEQKELIYKGSKMTSSAVFQDIKNMYNHLEGLVQGQDLKYQYGQLKIFQMHLSNALKDINQYLSSNIDDAPQFASYLSVLKGTLLNIYKFYNMPLFTSEQTSKGINSDLFQISSQSVTAVELLERAALQLKVAKAPIDTATTTLVDFHILSTGSIKSQDYYKFTQNKNIKGSFGHLNTFNDFVKPIIKESLENAKKPEDIATIRNVIGITMSSSGQGSTSSNNTSTTNKDDLVIKATLLYNSGAKNKKDQTFNYAERIDAKLGEDRYKRQTMFKGLIGDSVFLSKTKVPNIEDIMLSLMETIVDTYLTKDEDGRISFEDGNKILLNENSNFSAIDKMIKRFILYTQFLAYGESNLQINDLDNIPTLINVSGVYVFMSEFLKVIHKIYFLEDGGSQPKTIITDMHIRTALLTTDYDSTSFFKQVLMKEILKTSLMNNINQLDAKTALDIKPFKKHVQDVRTF